MQVLQFVEVCKQYDAFRRALDSISFEVESGEFLALAGPSGSGKSTALNLAAGLDLPSSGIVKLLGHSLESLSRTEIFELRREKIGFIFQAYNLFPVLTALENIEYPLALKGVSKKERTARSLKALEEVGLNGLHKRFPKELSGGQQQRVAIARALVGNPELIFADEPTANLDTGTGAKLIELFKQLNDQKKITFVFSSHDPAVLQQAKRIIKMKDGKIETASAISHLRLAHSR